MSDGRLTLDPNKKYPQYERVFETKKDVLTNPESHMLKGHMMSTQLSKVFFSPENIQNLQLGMKNMVYEKSCKKYVIGKQSEDELMIIMRAIYLQNAKHTPYDIKQQVVDLNKMVIAYAVPRIISEISMYFTYIKDATNAPNYWERGLATSSKGTKTLEFPKRWV